MSGINTQNKIGSPIQVGEGTQIRLVSQSASWIEKTWGVVWNRPAAVRVETEGSTQVLPIVDVTRIGLVVLWGFTVAFLVMALRKPKKARSKQNE